jgi:hypothetical protein
VWYAAGDQRGRMGLIRGMFTYRAFCWKGSVMSAPLASGIPKKQMSFVWVSDHWDVHLSGLCRHDGALCRFERDNPEDDGEVLYSIYHLTTAEKLRWLYRKWKFEICVGYHWTYPNRANGEMFHRRKPTWLYFLLWAWYWKSFKEARQVFYRKVSR